MMYEERVGCCKCSYEHGTKSAVALAVSLLPLAVDVRVRSQANSLGICGGQSGTKTSFSSSTSVDSSSVKFPMANITSPTCHAQFVHLLPTL